MLPYYVPASALGRGGAVAASEPHRDGRHWARRPGVPTTWGTAPTQPVSRVAAAIVVKSKRETAKNTVTVRGNKTVRRTATCASSWPNDDDADPPRPR